MNEEVSKDPARVFVLVGVYPTKNAAEADQKTVKKLHASDMTGKFETTVITRDEQGQVHVAKGESNSRTWAAEGLVVGAVLGALFPPSILLTAGAGAALGGLGASRNGLELKGIPAKDLDQLGQAITPGEAALVVVGEESARRGDQVRESSHRSGSRRSPAPAPTPNSNKPSSPQSKLARTTRPRRSSGGGSRHGVPEPAGELTTCGAPFPDQATDRPVTKGPTGPTMRAGDCRCVHTKPACGPAPRLNPRCTPRAQARQVSLVRLSGVDTVSFDDVMELVVHGFEIGGVTILVGARSPPS